MNKQLHKNLFLLAIPMVLSNITAPLLGLVDTAVIGHLPEAYYLGGSTIGATIITIVTWLCGFLRMTTTGLSAQAYGAENFQENLLVLARGIVVAVAVGLVFIAIQSWYIPAAVGIAGGSENVQFYATQYSEIRIWSLLAALTNLVIIGWLLGNHKVRSVMWIFIAMNLINLLLDLLFVVVFDWKVHGVAWATLIAEYSGLCMALFVGWRLIKEKSNGQISLPKSDLFEKAPIRQYFQLNRDILLRTLALQVCFVFITFQGARLGDTVVAANAILMNFLLFISFGLDGIANAAEVMVGKAKGANDRREFRQVIWVSLFWTLIFAVVYASCFYLYGSYLINIISSIKPVVTYAEQFLNWIVILPIVACWSYLFDGIYIGLTRGQVMRNSMIVSTVVGFFPAWWLLQDLHNHALWAALSIFMLFRGATLAGHLYWTRNQAL